MKCDIKKVFNFMISDNIQLKISSILNVPLGAYNEFSFIVNEKVYKTTQIISDLLSPKICQIHKSDPTANSFIIDTENKGDFSKILKLVNFEVNPLFEEDIDFISEVVEILGNDSIQIKIQPSKITIDNVIDLYQKHSKSSIFYTETIDHEIDLISSNLGEILDKQEEKLMSFDISSLERIIKNQNLQIKDENQLLSFICHLYIQDTKYSPLFEYVLFENVNRNKIIEFLDIFDYQYLTNETWRSISQRLKQEIKQIVDQKSNIQKTRYKQMQQAKPSQTYQSILIVLVLIQSEMIFYGISPSFLLDFNKYFMLFQLIFNLILTNILSNSNKHFIKFQQTFYQIPTNI